MTKLKAFSLHLVISAAVTGALLLALVRFWYPMPYFVADGGWQGLRLVCCIDLVLGPLLTLVVFKDWKPRRTLVVDYAVIATLQALALVFGIWTVFAQRTVLVTFSDGSFYTIDAQTASSIGPRAAAVRARSPGTPAYAQVAMPEDSKQRQEIRKMALNTRALYLFDQLLEGFAPARRNGIQEFAIDAARLPEKWPDAAVGVRRFAERNSHAVEDYDFFPVVARYRTFLLAFRRTAGLDTAPYLLPDGYVWAGSERDGKGRPPSATFPRVTVNPSRGGGQG